MFAHVHSQVFSAWGFTDCPVEWGVPWTGVDPYADSLAQPTIDRLRTDAAAAERAGLRQPPQPRMGAQPAASGSERDPLRLNPGSGDSVRPVRRPDGQTGAARRPSAVPRGPIMSTDEPTVPQGYANGLFDLKGRVAVDHRRRQRPRRRRSRSATPSSASPSIIADVNLTGAEATLATITGQGGQARRRPARRHQARRMFRPRRGGRSQTTVASTSSSTAPARPSAAPPRAFPRTASTSSSTSTSRAPTSAARPSATRC